MNDQIRLADYSKLLARSILICGCLCSLVLFPANVAAQEEEEEFVQEGFEETDSTKDRTQDPIALFKSGQAFHESGDLEKALEMYRKALKAMPEFPEAEFQVASILVTKGETKGAEEALRRAISYRRDWTLALVALGKVLITNGKYSEAAQQLEKAISINPKASDAYVGLADLYEAKNPGEDKYKKLYSRLIYFSSGARATASIWSAKAAVELKLNLLKEAAESIGRSLQIEPDNLRAQVLEIQYALKTGDAEGAVASSEALVAKFPEAPEYVVLLANAHIANSSREKAIKVLDDFKGNDPQISLMKSSLETASEVDTEKLEAIVKKEPKNIAALTTLCNSLRRGQPMKALEYCRSAYAIEPTNVKHAIGFGAALVQLRKFDAAVKLLEDIKQRYPKNYTARANLASAYFQMKAFEKAKQEYLWITTNSPEVHIAFYLLGICHDRLEEFPEAYASYQSFLRVADKDRFADEIERVTLRLTVLKDNVKKKKRK